MKILTAIPPHIVLRDFLGSDLSASLLDLAEQRAATMLPSRIGLDGTIDPSIRSSLQTRDLGDLHAPLANRFHAAMAPALAALGMAHSPIDGLELQLAAHRDGAFYSRHIDTHVGAERAGHRVLSCVYYFHALPRRFTGGAIRLYSFAPPEGGGQYIDIEPDNDTVLFFPSWVPHEVLPVACPDDDLRSARFAINCWFRRAV